MLRDITVVEQLLPVLRAAHLHMASGLPAATAWATGCHEIRRERKLRYATITDLADRLGLRPIRRLYDLLDQWSQGDGRDLMAALLRYGPPETHAEIRRVFEEISKQQTLPEASPIPSKGREPGQPAGDQALTPPVLLRQLDGETLRVLQHRARDNGRSLEAEIVATLGASVREGRRQLADWAARLRAGMEGRYTGDSTAEIRADRDR